MLKDLAASKAVTGGDTAAKRKSRPSSYSLSVRFILLLSILVNAWLLFEHFGNREHGREQSDVELTDEKNPSFRLQWLLFKPKAALEARDPHSNTGQSSIALISSSSTANAILRRGEQRLDGDFTAIPTLGDASKEKLAPQIDGSWVSFSNFTFRHVRDVTSASISNAKVLFENFIRQPLVDTKVQHHSTLPYGATNTQPPVLCSTQIVGQLAKPRLSLDEFAWCKWALSPSGGQVKVGSSWGKLIKKEEQKRFDSLDCNAVHGGRNPSCNDQWGDAHMLHWKLNGSIEQYKCDSSRSSAVNCYRNVNADVFCVLENAQINFAAYRKVERQGRTNSKQFRNDFINTDCSGPSSEAPAGFPFSHLYTPHITNPHCDYVHNGTVLMFSHDEIRNLGHMLNDIFNVWVMMWLDGLAGSSQSLDMLNIDSFKLGHNFDDQPNAFFLPYQKNLRRIFKGVDFADKTLCLKRVLLQPLPPRQLIWESWNADMPCSFVGPSSLYQRWNRHMRSGYGILGLREGSAASIPVHAALAYAPTAPFPHPVHAASSNGSSKMGEGSSRSVSQSGGKDIPMHLVDKRNREINTIRVLLVLRNETTNPWGSARTSRNILNEQEVIHSLEETLLAVQERYNDRTVSPIGRGTAASGAGGDSSRDVSGGGYSSGSSGGPAVYVDLVARDMRTLPLLEQVKLIASASVLVGMHGAGFVSRPQLYSSIPTTASSSVLFVAAFAM